MLSPTSIVPTPGVVHHELLTPEREHLVEPVEVMAAAALALVTDPPGLTGRIAYSQQLLWELGLGPEPLERAARGRAPPHRRRTRRGVSAGR